MRYLGRAFLIISIWLSGYIVGHGQRHAATPAPPFPVAVDPLRIASPPLDDLAGRPSPTPRVHTPVSIQF